jgi:hypothetical protein
MKAQWQQVLDHMKKHGSIDSEEAEREYGILRLHKRIIYLKLQGYNITEEKRTKVDRWGKEYKWPVYLLSDEDTGDSV